MGWVWRAGPASEEKGRSVGPEANGDVMMRGGSGW